MLNFEVSPLSADTHRDRRGRRYSLPFRVVACVLLVAFTGLFTGCGSNREDFVVTGTGPVGSGPTDGFFLGRVLLEDFIQDSDVQITNLAGKQLYSFKTLHKGFFYTRGALPADFRITATRPGDATIYSREVRGGYDKLTMYVNPLTTIASRLVTESGLTLSEAESRVKTYYSLPAGYSLDWITNSKASPFSPAGFFELANRSGDIDGYFDQVVSDIAGGAGTQQQSVVLDIEQPEGNLINSLIKTTVGDVFSDAISLGDAGIFGAITQALGFNLGTSGALNAISEQLDQVLSEIGALNIKTSQNAADQGYNDALNAIGQNLVDLEDNNGDIVKLAQSSSNQTAAQLVSQIQALQVEDLVNLVVEYVTGAEVTNIILSYNQKVTSDNLFITGSEATSYLGYPVRFNQMTEDLQTQAGYFISHLGLAMNLYAENAHLQVPLTSSLAEAGTAIDGLIAATRQAENQVPALLNSNDVILDVPNNLMWYAVFMPQDTYENAIAFSTAQQEGGYTGWRLPTQAELSDFVLNRIAVQTGVTSTGDYGQITDSQWRSAFGGYTKSTHNSASNGASSGVPGYAFDLTNYGQQTYDSNTGLLGNDTYQGQAYYNLDSDPGANNDNLLQWYGVNKVQTTSYYLGANGDKSTYLLVRDFPGTTDTSGGSNPLASGQLGDPTNMDIGAKSPTEASSAMYFVSPNGATVPQVDLTNATYWQVFDSQDDLNDNRPSTQATISNYNGTDLETTGATIKNSSGDPFTIPTPPTNSYPGPGNPGTITWHPHLDGTPLTPVIVKGTFYGPAPGSANAGVTGTSGTRTFNPPDPNAVPVISSSSLVPYQPTINLSNVGSGSVEVTFRATTFYQDGQLYDPYEDSQVAGNNVFLQFHLVNSAGETIDSDAEGGGFIVLTPNPTTGINSTLNVLSLNSNLPIDTYEVQVTYNTPLGTAPVTGTIARTLLNISFDNG